MTLEQLRIFLEVARLQHVTRASETLHLTQSAVSAALAALEAQHGVPLFDRVGRGIVLNEAGRMFMPLAGAVLRRASEAENWLAELRGGEVGTLRLQASQTVATYFLPSHLIRFQRLHPRVTLNFIQGNTATVAAAVRSGETDLGIVEGRVDNHGLRQTTVGGDRLVLLVGASHSWRQHPHLSATALAAADWVLREAGSGTRALFDEALQGHCINPVTPMLELPSNEACIAAVETGHGATVLSEHAAAPHCAAGRVFEVPFSFPERAFTALSHSERSLSRAAENFLASLRR